MKDSIIVYLVIAFMFFVFICGCGDVSDSESSQRPKIVSLSVTEGGTIPIKSPIDIKFSKTMKFVKVAVYLETCDQVIDGQVELNGDTARWTWPIYTPDGFDWGISLAYSGNCILSITGADEWDLKLEDFKPLNFKVSGPG